jgi:hypothetical protein
MDMSTDLGPLELLFDARTSPVYSRHWREAPICRNASANALARCHRAPPAEHARNTRSRGSRSSICLRRALIGIRTIIGNPADGDDSRAAGGPVAGVAQHPGTADHQSVESLGDPNTAPMQVATKHQRRLTLTDASLMPGTSDTCPTLHER